VPFRSALPLLFLLAADARAQEFKPPEKIAKERFPLGLHVTKVKESSKFAALRFLPAGWDLFIVAVNGRRVVKVDGAARDRHLADCTDIHRDLTATAPVRLTFILKSLRNSPVLIELVMPSWDGGLVYPVRAWAGDSTKSYFPSLSAEVGSESFDTRRSYSDVERRVEITDFDRRRRDDAAKKKNPAIAIKDLEWFKAVQRRLRIDEGAEAEGEEEELYKDARLDLADRLTVRAGACWKRKAWEDYFRATLESGGMLGGMNPKSRDPGFFDRMKKSLGELDEDAKGRVRTKGTAEAQAALKEKRYLDAALKATLSRLAGDEEAVSVVRQARIAAFDAPEMPKTELDLWLCLLGGLAAPAELTAGQAYRLDGIVEKAGAFTLMKTAKGAPVRWVFEDKAGLKLEDGDAMLGVGVSLEPDPAMPEEFRTIPRMRLVLIR
jgi:hypothetical protein